MFQEMELSSLVFFLYFRKELSERAKRKQNKKKNTPKKTSNISGNRTF